MKKVLYLFTTISLIFVFLLLTSCNKDKEKAIDSSTSTGKVEIEESMVNIQRDSFDYNGKSKTFSDYDIVITYNNEEINHNYFYFNYDNNTSPSRNKALLTVVCKDDNPYLTGSYKYYFSIIDRSETKVKTLDEINDTFNDGGYKCVIESETILEIKEDETLIIPRGFALYNNGKIINYGKIITEERKNEYTNGGLITNNYGVIINTEKGIITNDGRFVNGGMIYNDGEFKNNSNVTNSVNGKIYSNIVGNPVVNNGNAAIIRGNIKDNLTNVKMGYFNSTTLKTEFFDKVDGKFQVPYLDDGYGFIISINGSTIASNYYEVEDYSTLGVHKVLLNFDAIKMSDQYYGTGEIEFEIIKNEVKFKTFDELKSIINSDLYDKYIYTGSEVLYINEDITIPEGKELINNTNYNISASNNITVINNGKITNDKSQLYFGYKFINNGEISSYSIRNKNDFTNKGNINTGSIAVEGKIINDGIIDVKTSVDFSNYNIQNNNEIIIEGNANISNLDNNNFVNTGKITNNGTLYLYKTISNVVNNAPIIKKNIDTLASLTTSSYDYDGKEHKPSVYIENNPLPNLKYTYSSNTTDYGTKIVTAMVNSEFVGYYGEATLEYTVNRVDKVIEESYEFGSAVANTNYKKFILGASISIYSGDYSMLAPFDLNGYSLLLDGTAKLTITSDLTSKPLTNSTNTYFASIILKNSSRLTVGSTYILINTGTIYFENDYYSKLNATTITGDGSIYIDQRKNLRFENTDNENTIYERKDLDDLVSPELSLSSSSFTYNGNVQKPDVLINGSSYQLDLTYPESKAHGTYEVIIELTDKLFDHNYFGTTSREYKILSNTLLLNNSNFVQSSFDIDTYDRYELTEDITSTFNITIPDEATLDIGQYRMTMLDSSTINRSKLTLSPTTELYVKVDNITEFNIYKYIATYIKLTGDINNLDIIYTNQISESETIFTNVTGYNPYKLTIDLNGHNISNSDTTSAQAILINNQVTEDARFNNYEIDSVYLSIINSSSTTSNITSTTNSIYAIRILSTGTKYLNMYINGDNNINITGIELKGSQTKLSDNLTNLYMDKITINTTSLTGITHAFEVGLVSGTHFEITNSTVTGVRYGISVRGGDRRVHLVDNCTIIAGSGDPAVTAQFYVDDEYSTNFNIRVSNSTLSGKYGAYVSIDKVQIRSSKVLFYLKNNTYNVTEAEHATSTYQAIGQVTIFVVEN